MSGMARSGCAVVAAILLAITTVMCGAFAGLDRTVMGSSTKKPVELAASAYSDFLAGLPSLPPLDLGINIPGVTEVFDNVTGVLPWDYGAGLTLGNSGGLGIQAWDPSSPLFTAVAESVGSNTANPNLWGGAASLVGIETLLGGFTNTESYANLYDPLGSTCLICDTFQMLGPGNTDLFQWTTVLPIPFIGGGSPEFEAWILGQPVFDTATVFQTGLPTGPFTGLGNAFDYSPLANGFTNPVTGVETIPGQAAAELTSLLGTNVGANLSMLLGTNLGADLSSLLTSVGADFGRQLSTDLGTLLPTLLTSLIP